MARTTEPTTQGTGTETLYIRVDNNFQLEYRIGPRGRYVQHFTYTNAYKAFCIARKLSKRMNCINFKIMAFPGELPNARF